MNESLQHKEMIETVARALGPEMLEEVAFVGGCTTALLLTDQYSVEQVRHTDDVDLIVHLVAYSGWVRMRDELLKKGFREEIGDDPICALKLGELRVDFMPDNSQILSFTNRWYADALQTADKYQLAEDLVIQLVSPPYFVATKLEAYAGRGNNDPLESRDIEDILTLLGGRENLLQEISHAPAELKKYVADQFSSLLPDRNFEFAVSDAAGNDEAREALIFERIEKLIEIGNTQ